MLLLAVDAALWGLWFGAVWMYRPALASRLGASYSDVNAIMSVPLAAAAAMQLAIGVLGLQDRAIAEKPLSVLRRWAVAARASYLLAALVLTLVPLDVVGPRGLLALTTVLFAAGYAAGAVAGVAWSEYMARGIPDEVKVRYVGVQSVVSNLSSLGGTVLAGYLLVQGHGVGDYAKLFLYATLPFVAGLSVFFLLEEAPRGDGYGAVGGAAVDARLYTAVALALFAINLPAALVVPYIMRVWGGDETWVSVINGSSWIASIASPMIWSVLIERLGALRSAAIAVILGALLNAVFPYMPSIGLQGARAFGMGFVYSGLWLTVFSYLIRDVSSADRVRGIARVFALQNAVPAAAMTTGSLAADYLTGPEAVFIASLVGLVAAPLFAGAAPRPRSGPEATGGAQRRAPGAAPTRAPRT